MLPTRPAGPASKRAEKPKKERAKRAPRASAKQPAPAPNDTTETFARFEPPSPEDDAVEPFSDWGGFTEEFEAVVDDDDASSEISYEDSVTTDASVSESLENDEIVFDQPDSPRASIWSVTEKRMKPAARAKWRSSGSRVLPDCDDDIF